MTLTILVLEDDEELLRAFERDLAGFGDRFRMETAESLPEAWERIETVCADDDELALVLCECKVRGESGVEFLIALAQDERYDPAKKMMITGDSGVEDAIRAVNNAHLDQYLTRPWDPGELQEEVRELLTDYVLENDVDPLPYMTHLDDERVMEIWR
ncbi:response regulator [Actinomycetaceae bacterium L2_0104]